MLGALIDSAAHYSEHDPPSELSILSLRSPVV